MKIAIYHNLEPGGALNYLIETSKILHKKNKIDIYSFKNNVPKNSYDNLNLFELNKTKNIFSHIIQILFELKTKNYNIAKLINKRKYDLVIVHPCLLTQAPFVLQKINQNNTIYIFHETKREFYENTNYMFFKPKNIAQYILRYFIKFIDVSNCKKAKNIVSNSAYSAYILLKYYNKKSLVVHLGRQPIKPKRLITTNNRKIISSGILEKIKGHEFTIKQISTIYSALPIIGKTTKETDYLFEIASKLKIKIELLNAFSYKEVRLILKKYSIYISNPNSEPFGIATLEATENKLYVIGKNEGGSPEIIYHGLNGFLYPNNIFLAKKTLKSIYSKNDLVIYKNSKIDWNYSVSRILSLYHHLTHTPNE